MALPIFTTDDKNMLLLQTNWATLLNPLLKSPMLLGQVLKSEQLATGVNIINHKLGRKLQGWSIVRQRGSASIYDQQDTNSSPQLTLALVSSAAVSVDIYVF